MNRKQCEVGDRVKIRKPWYGLDRCFGIVEDMTDSKVRILVEYDDDKDAFPDDIFVLGYDDLERCFEPGEKIIINKPGSVLNNLIGYIKKDDNDDDSVEVNLPDVSETHSLRIERQYVAKYKAEKKCVYTNKHVYTNEDFNVGDKVMVEKADSNFNGMIGQIVEKYGNMASVWIFGFDQLVFYYSDLSLLPKVEEDGNPEKTGDPDNEETGESKYFQSDLTNSAYVKLNELRNKYRIFSSSNFYIESKDAVKEFIAALIECTRWGLTMDCEDDCVVMEIAEGLGIEGELMNFYSRKTGEGLRRRGQSYDGKQ